MGAATSAGAWAGSAEGQYRYGGCRPVAVVPLSGGVAATAAAAAPRAGCKLAGVLSGRGCRVAWESRHRWCMWGLLLVGGVAARATAAGALCRVCVCVCVWSGRGAAGARARRGWVKECWAAGVGAILLARAVDAQALKCVCMCGLTRRVVVPVTQPQETQLLQLVSQDVRALVLLKTHRPQRHTARARRRSAACQGHCSRA